MKKHLEAQGYLVLCVQESATLLMRGGVKPGPDYFLFQQSIFTLQRTTEDVFLMQAAASAARGDNVVVLLDSRGSKSRFFCAVRSFFWLYID